MKLFNYYAFNLIIASQIKLPGIVETRKQKEPDLTILRGNVDPLNAGANMDGLINYHVNNDEIYLWWDDIGKVKIKSGNQIIVDLNNNKIDFMIPFLLGPVMALLLHQKGFLVLHGSAVNIKDGVAAFVGQRGIGKSTIAVHLLKNGYPLITDDIIAIRFDNNIPHIYPGYYHVRLSKDSYSQIKDYTHILSPIRTLVGKSLCDASNGFSSEPLKLKKIYLLEKGQTMRIFKLKSQDVLIKLINNSVANEIFSKKDQVKNLIECTNLINNASISILKINHSYNTLPNSIIQIENDFKN